MEEPGKHLCRDTVHTGEHKNHNTEQPRPGQGTVPSGIHLVQVEGKPGRARSPTVHRAAERSANIRQVRSSVCTLELPAQGSRDPRLPEP